MGIRIEMMRSFGETETGVGGEEGRREAFNGNGTIFLPVCKYTFKKYLAMLGPY